jgi:hypothetical protein
MAGCGLPRTNRRAPSFSLCCSPTVRRLLVLHDESNPTTSCLVRASDADEIIDDRIDILRLDRCFVVHARVCHRRKLYISFVLAGLGFVPTHATVAGEVDSRYALIATERDAAPRVSECRPEVDEAIELCSFWFGGT